MEDSELIAKILSRDRQALYTFYRMYTPRLQGFIASKVQNPHDAEELFQDTLFAFLEAVRDFHGKASVKTFLFSICQHKIIDYYRRKKFRHIVFSQMPHLEELVSPILNPEEELDATILKDRLKKAFNIILPQYKIILQMKYLEDLSVEAIAQKLDLTFKSAESILFRARKAFAKAFVAI